ncbi:hypothetical protein SRB5_18560 [Streptomyces sp. RB5]|uniref:Phosphatidic acid phosphatase type 2/haloperoxidase domain-containing protein n=1 Tax=Streptomyces smaragdinus TaxID=2585196 RepID=A0A7K0CE32_9ACTN|nr:phosphatase PAP2 family protein [Streptomyces smaragdinus]MQY11737.1 hypothetical protein [Streptomyces smaragdinus]
MRTPTTLNSPATAPVRQNRLLLAVLFCCFVLLLALVALDWGPLDSADASVDDALHESAVSSPGATHTMRVLTDWVWDPWTMRAVLFVAAGWLVWRGERPAALWVAATGLAGVGLQQGVKAAVGRERPVWPDPVDHASYAAFPSGHAMSTAVTCGLVLWLLRRSGAGPLTWRIAVGVAVVSVVGVGFTRVYLGVHWPSDVVGGWLLGAVLVGGSVVAFDSYEGSLRGRESRA